MRISTRICVFRPKHHDFDEKRKKSEFWTKFSTKRYELLGLVQNWPKLTKNWPKIGQFWPPWDPSDPPTPIWTKKTRNFRLSAKNRLLFEKWCFFGLFCLLWHQDDPFSLFFPICRILVRSKRLRVSIYTEKRVLARVFSRINAFIRVFRFFWLFWKKNTKKTPSKPQSYVNISYKKQLNKP
jgi:hypothetical protein